MTRHDDAPDEIPDEALLRIGELARRTGLTVRTLHHYDHLGLLVPSTRSAADYRLYGPADVERLLRIRVLRQLGLSLDEVRIALDGPTASLVHVLGLRTQSLREEIHEQRALLSRLEALERRLATAGAIDLDELVDTLERMTAMETMFEKYYTPEQLASLGERAASVGAERMQQVAGEWEQVFAGFREASAAGEDPASERVQALAARARGLIAEFTGGDAGIERSLDTMYREEGAPKVLEPHGYGLEPEVAEYMQRAMAVTGDSARRVAPA